LVLERTTGRLIFGDGVHGRIPPADSGNILAAEYRSGGGLVGNVPKGSISQLLSGVTAQSVTNPRMAEAGADGETIAQVLQRGPFVTRHRYQGVARLDYEEMAQQASPGVAVARAYPAAHPNGRPAPGWVTLVVVPQSTDAQPQPTFGLRQLVHDFIAARAPATLERLAVIGPTYLPVGVNVSVSPLDPSNAGPVGASVRAALTAFLHPLTGGPEGQGWPFGRNVYLSDVARLVESIEGVDYASSIELLLHDTPVGDVALVPNNRMVAAGTVRVMLGEVEV
jgi:predicted phage baseplate assembly protein